MTRHPLTVRFYCKRPEGPCDKPCIKENIGHYSGEPVYFGDLNDHVCGWFEVVNEVALAKGN